MRTIDENYDIRQAEDFCDTIVRSKMNIKCPHCGYPFNLDEALLNRRQFNYLNQEIKTYLALTREIMRRFPDNADKLALARSLATLSTAASDMEMERAVEAVNSRFDKIEREWRDRER